MSRRILDTFQDASGLPVTATFAAYMIEGGFRTYLEAQDSAGFDAWYSARWDEFAFANGLVSPFASGEDRRRVVDWLDQRATDHVAQRAVEAA